MSKDLCSLGRVELEQAVSLHFYITRNLVEEVSFLSMIVLNICKGIAEFNTS